MYIHIYTVDIEGLLRKDKNIKSQEKKHKIIYSLNAAPQN